MSDPLGDDATPIVVCPQCGAEQEDFDGFGVLHCNACGFCTHASEHADSTGRYTCGLCGRVSDPGFDAFCEEENEL
jgi:hypothetical protein